jgi:hypothetical protein
MKSNSYVSSLLLLLAAAACGDSTSGGADAPNTSTPTVVSTSPGGSAIDIVLNTSVGATFSEPMSDASLTSATFTVAAGSTAVVGTVIYADSSVVFWPAARLPASTSFTATITTGAKSASGVALGANYTWSFTTGTTPGMGTPVNLRSAGNYVIVAKSGISTVPTSAVTGNLAVSPAAASYITGFSLSADSSNTFSTSTQVTGKVYAANYTSPTPSKLTTAVNDMATAFTDAAGRAPDVTELGAGNIGGMTLVPGVYKWGTGLTIPTSVILAGSATDVWIFQIAQNVTMAAAKTITLSGGAVAKNVFWQVAGSVDIGTTSHFEGTILSKTSITLHTGSSLNGRIYAQTAASIDGSTVVQPAP